MNQHIEIEYKNLLSKESFDHLITHFRLTESSFANQANHYFDTKGFSLKEQKSALRIREKNGRFELTLKQPAETGLLETNQPITKEEAEAVLSGKGLPEGAVKKLLEDAGIHPEQVLFFGTLTTNRAEIPYEGGLLVFDHSSYLGKEDYELEYETDDPEAGKRIFHQLLETLNIPLIQTENKVKRFYLAMQEKS